MENGHTTEPLSTGLHAGVTGPGDDTAVTKTVEASPPGNASLPESTLPVTNGVSVSDILKPEVNGSVGGASEEVSADGMTGLAVPSEPITGSAKAVEEATLPAASETEKSLASPSEHADLAVEHTVAVDAPMSDLREEHLPTQKPAELSGSASVELKSDSLVGDTNLKTSNAPQSPISPPQERSEVLADLSAKPDAVSAPTPPQSAAVSPRPASQEAQETPVESAPSSELKQDLPMTDGATPAVDSAAVKHERTEDSSEQPNKRPRTDDGGSGSASPAVKFSEEADFARKMTTNRQKYSLTVLRQLKKSKDSAPFMQPVDPVKLKIPDYFKIVTNPQDLGTIESKLKKNEFETVDQFTDAVELVWSNCQKYNGPDSPINQMALRLKETFERQIRSMPPAEESEPASARGSKAKKGGKATGTPVAARSRKMSTSTPSSGVPAIRRESMGVDGRPKREIHAPPPKSLPYQNATQKKGKNAKQLKFCGAVLKEMFSKKHDAFAFPFHRPVDAVALGLHDYHTIIKKPMDLSTMQQKLNNGEYETADDFEYDMRLMFRNCYKYNGQGTAVNAMGKSLESVFQQKWAEKPLARPAGASDSEDESDNEMANKQTVEMLTKQLKAMEDKIASINAAKKSKKPKKTSYYDDEDGGMGPRDSDYVVSSSKKGRKRRDSNGEFDESPMFPTFEQKSELSQKMGYMTEHQMPVVVEILKQGDPNFDPEDDEVELDVDKINPKTIRLLWNWIIEGQEPSFLRKKAAKAKKNRSVMSESEQQRKIQQLEAHIEKFNGGDVYGSRYADKADDSSNSDASSEEDD